ncbi:glycosyltransferase family 2 protein [Francisella sp. SYW-9]|uniref:glycosyltransferase family 2 protein n=1 Tax=Francisella sp. SYW-9 TaxID=2610888 RepID=UPI00168D53DF|nr:glycosyltransferase family 2 protein [Francisella sp. SYW-9]
MKKLTVLMPAYNVEDYISQAIESVLMQNVDFEYELLIIDDKSTDNTLKIALEYQQKYPEKIAVIKNDVNMRTLAATIKGYEITKTDYFCVLDPDDYYIKDDFFKKAIEFLDQNSKYTLYCNNSYVLDTKTQKKQKFIHSDHSEKTFVLEDLVKGNAILANTTSTVFRNVVFRECVPADLYNAVNTYSEKSFEGDGFRNFLHLSKGAGYFSAEIVAVYRVTHDGVWTSLPDVKKDLMQAQLYRDMNVFFKDLTISDFMLNQSYKYFKQMLLGLMSSYTLRDSRTREVSLPSHFINFLQVDKLYEHYSNNYESLIAEGDWDQFILEKDKLLSERESQIRSLTASYENSLSWRITKPLRFVRAILSFKNKS